MASAIWKTLFGTRDSPEDIQGPASLSEEACGDLVHSLVRLGYLANISHSLDGKSFITHEQLTQDVLLQLDKRNGRVSLLDLPKALNANLSDIHDRVQELIRSRPGQLIHVQDELLKVEYLSNMATELNEELTKQGYLTIADLCRRYKFGIDFMRQFLKDRVGSTIVGQWDTVDRGLIVAPLFLEKEKAALVKALGDLEEPTSLQSLRSRHIVQYQLFYGLCDILSKEKGLLGLFRGVNDQGFFVPRPYGQQQTEWIETFFKNNGFIEFESIKKRGVADPRGYIQANHPSAILLDIHAVKDSIWSIVDASVEDTISNLSWIDVKPLLPSPLTKDDIASLLRQLPSLAEPSSRIVISSDQDHSLTGFGGGPPQEAIVIQESIVVTSGQLQKCLLKMGPLLDRSLKNLVSWRLSFGDSNQMDGQDEDDDPYITGDRGSSLKGIVEHVLNMQIPQRKSGSKAKNGQAGSGKNGGKKKKQIQDFLTVQDVKEEIKQLEPVFDPGLVNATAGILYRDLVQNLKDRNRSVVLNQMQEEEEYVEVKEDKERYMENKSISSAIQSLSKRIELSSKGIDVFEDSSMRNSLSKYLLQSWCVELLDLAVLHLASLNATVTGELSEVTSIRERLETSYAEHRSQIDKSSSAQGPFIISLEDTIALLKLIPEDTADTFKKLRKLTAGSGKQKSLIEYLDIWSSLSQNSKLGLDIIGNDEKDNRQWIVEHMKELHQILAGINPSSDPALMLHIVTLIAFQRWTGCMLHASGKYVPRVLRQLRQSVEQQLAVKSSDHQDGTIILQLDLLEKMLDSVLSNVKQQQQQKEGGVLGNNQDDLNQLWQSVYDLGTTLSSS